MSGRIFAIVGLIVFSGDAFSLDLRLPFQHGETWGITTGYGGSSTHQGKDFYALDFNLAGSSDSGKPILAAEDGVVIRAEEGHNGGYGNIVDIDHGNGYATRYTHLQSISVKSDDCVARGMEVGKCGSTGFSTGAHLHFVLYKNGTSIKPEPMSGYLDFSEGGSYKSNNFPEVSGHYIDRALHIGITKCVDQFSSLIGVPACNGGSIYVHDWYSSDGNTYITLQDFYNSQSKEWYAIVSSAGGHKAYLMRGAIRNHYLEMPDVQKVLGPPMSDEQPFMYYEYRNGAFNTGGPMRTYIKQDFVVGGNSLLWHPEYGVLLFNPFGSGGGTVEIAIVPGNGVDITLDLRALSQTEVYVTASTIPGAAGYGVYQNGSYVGDLVNAELKVQNLQASTAYRYVVIAYDVYGKELKRSAEYEVTTIAPPSPGSITVSLAFHDSYLDAMWTAVNGVGYYNVLVNGKLRQTETDPFCQLWNIERGQTYRVRVEAFSSDGVLLATGSASMTTSQNIRMYFVGAPSTVGPNRSGSFEVYLHNDTPDVLENFDATWSQVIPQHESWMTVTPTRYEPPAYINPFSTVKLCTVEFQTADRYPLAGTTSVSVVAWAKCKVPSLSLSQLFISEQAYMAVEPFVDLNLSSTEAEFGEWEQDEMVYGSFVVENEANATCPPARLNVYVNDELTTSVLTPQLAAREIIPLELPLGSYDQGDYTVVAIVDDDAMIAECREENNQFSGGFSVISTKPQLNIDTYPRYGMKDRAFVLGNTVNIVNPADYVTISYIKVFGWYYVKKDIDVTMPLYRGGKWWNQVFTTKNDWHADEIWTYLLPKGTDPPNCWPEPCSEPPLIPEAVDVDFVVRDKGELPSIRYLVVPQGQANPKVKHLKGVAYQVNPRYYGVMTYIKVDGIWYPKHTVDALSIIKPNGAWSCFVVTNTADRQATEVKSYVVPFGSELPDCWPEQCLDPPALPQAIATATWLAPAP